MASKKNDGKPRKRSTAKAVDETARALRHRILSGDLKPGDMLPGERELSERLGVSRLTLRSALAGLAAQGLIAKEHGAGNRVLDFREHGGVELVADLARLAIEDGRFPLRLLGDLLEFRRLIAVELLGLVAERGTSQQLLAIEDHLGELGKLVEEAEAFMHSDLAFTRLLVRAANNLSLELLYNTVERIVRNNPGYQVAFAVNARHTVEVYRDLYEVLRSRDPDRIRAEARRLLAPLDKRTLDRLAELASVMGSEASLEEVDT